MDWRGGIGYVEILAIRELLTRPLWEAFERGEMSRCHDDHSVAFLEARDVDADTFDNAGTFKGRGSIAGLNLACVDEDILYADIRDQ